MAKTFTVEIYGYGAEMCVGTVTKEQFESIHKDCIEFLKLLKEVMIKKIHFSYTNLRILFQECL